MALVIRKSLKELEVLVPAINSLKLAIGAGASYHLDQSERTVTVANAADLPTSVVLTNSLTQVYTFHVTDLLAHKATLTGANLAATTLVTDLASAMVRANDMKAKFNVHVASTVQHYNADAGVIATADATNLATLITLLNAIKAAFNTHVASGPATKSIRLLAQ